MADARTVRVRLTADVGNYLSQMAAASKGTSELAHSVDSIGESLEKLVQHKEAQQVAADARRQAAETKRAATQADQAWEKTGSGLAKFGGVAAAGVGIAVKAYSDFDSEMSAVAATGSDAASHIGQLRDAAMQAGRAFGQFSGKDAAEGIEQLAKAGMSVTNILGGGLTGALNLAAAGTMSVGDAAEVTAKTMSQFGLAGNQASHVADLLAAGAGKAVGDVSDMGQALAQSGLVAHQYGMSIEETTGTLALFAQNSLLGSDAGTSLKQMLLQLASPTKEAQAALDQYNISAYDSQGKFVGMSKFAGELHDKLGDLSQAQQNAALKTIFGADAIRSATILMQGGSQAVDQWTKAVNDQGYASQVAGKKMDNLKGDLKGLQGSFENLAISGASSSNGGLRMMVQTLTSITDWAGRHSSVTSSILAIAAGFGGLALAASGVIKATRGIQEFRKAVADLNIVSKVAGAAGGLKDFFTSVRNGSDGARESLVKFTAGAAALTAATIAVQAYGNATQASFAKARTGSDDLAAAMNKGQFDIADKFRLTEGIFIKDTMSMGQTIKRALDPTGLQSFTDGLNKMAFGTSATQEVTKNFAELDKAMTQVDGSKAATEFRKVADAATQQGVPIEQLTQLFPQYKAELEQTASTLGVSGLSAKDYAEWMGGKIPDAVQKAAAAQEQATGSTTTLAGAMSQEAEDAAKAAEQNNQLAQSVRDAGNAAIAASGSQVGYAQAVADATAKIADGRKAILATHDGFNLMSSSGRDAQTALNSVASAALQLETNQSKAGASTAAMSATISKGRADFVSLAEKMGMSAKAANALADAYKLIPASKSTAFTLQGGDAAVTTAGQIQKVINQIPPEKKAEILSMFEAGGFNAAKNAMDGLPKSVQTKIISAYTNGGVAAARSALASLPKKTQTTVISAFQRGGVSAALAALKGVPATKQAAIISAFQSGGVAAARAAIASVQGKTVTITTVHQNIIVNRMQTGTMPGLMRPSANGNIFSGADRHGQMREQHITGYANGGLREQHVAQIAKPGTWRLWAEPETGGEAYIPLAGSKRARSLAILEEVARRFGRRIVANANGSVFAQRTERQISHVDPDWSKLMAAVDKLAAATRANTIAQHDAATKMPGYTRALAVYNRDLAQKKLLNTRQQQEDLNIQTQIQRARAAAGGRTTRQVTELENRRRAQDLTQRKQMAAISAKVTAAEKAKNAELAKYKPIADKAAAAAAKMHDALEAETQAQQQVTEAAQQASTSFMSQYRKGGDITDLMANMKDGTAAANTFAWEIEQLRKRHVNEQVVQDIVGMGQGQGGDLAQELLHGNKKIIDQLNKASAALTKSADVLGTVEQIQVVRRATGGRISGPGTSTSDSINLRASDGEYMIRTQAAQSLGYGVLDYMNQHGQLPKMPAPAWTGPLQVQVDQQQIADAVFRGLASATVSMEVPGLPGVIDAQISGVHRKATLSMRTRGVTR